jgi:hypothetical protein
LPVNSRGSERFADAVLTTRLCDALDAIAPVLGD